MIPKTLMPREVIIFFNLSLFFFSSFNTCCIYNNYIVRIFLFFFQLQESESVKRPFVLFIRRIFIAQYTKYSKLKINIIFDFFTKKYNVFTRYHFLRSVKIFKLLFFVHIKKKKTLIHLKKKFLNKFDNFSYICPSPAVQVS